MSHVDKISERNVNLMFSLFSSVFFPVNYNFQNDDVNV